ncbi:MAG: 2OG-Fe(II) oxygenase [Myxococcota bacterium]|nr:2OG-Fe(II) oxygenase [Myxococcota bacterium]
MRAFSEERDAFPPAYAKSLRKQVLASRYFAVNTLNRDFVGTRGFSVVFRRDSLPRVMRELPYFAPYLERALHPECNAFYLNPLLLVGGSRVDPHIDRSLQSYVVHVDTPRLVTVMYVEVPPGMRGGELVLQRGKKHLGRITPTANTLVTFAGDLTHSIDRLDTQGSRLSLVCEQYDLPPEELEQIPELAIETRARY